MQVLTVLADNHRRRADHRAVVGNIDHIQETVGADTDITANCQRPQQGRPGADEDIITQSRMPFPLMLARTAKSDIVKQDTVFADDCRFANNHSGTVIDKKASPDCRAGMDFDTGQKTIDFGKKSRDKGNAQIPEDVDKPMPENGMESGIKQKFYIAGSRVVAINGPGILDDVFTNHMCIYFRNQQPNINGLFFVEQLFNQVPGLLFDLVLDLFFGGALIGRKIRDTGRAVWP